MAGGAGPPAGSPSLRTLLDRYPTTSPAASEAGAAVLIVLRDGAREVEVLLIERSTREDDPASGQIALPGGHVEPVDADLRATALRELEEEVGLAAADLVLPVRYVGKAEARWFRTTVGIFAARLGPAAARPTPGNVREVASVFWLPLPALSDTRRVDRDTAGGPVEVDATVHEGHVLWGFTRRVLREFSLGSEPGGASLAPTREDR
jgi:8-oxo-dGTP pyrophosphatase MutT (NUDIX family)